MAGKDKFQSVKKNKPRSYQSSSLTKDPVEWELLESCDWNRKVIVEVGCGTGKWICEAAQSHPENFYIGIERTLNRSSQFVFQSQNLKLENLIAIRADAIEIISHKFYKESVDEFYFFYPNPYPKKSQGNKRYFVAPSFQVFLNALKPAGKIYLASNIYEYVQEAEFFLKEYWRCQIQYKGLIEKNIQPRTLFEKKYVERGEKLFELEARKL